MSLKEGDCFLSLLATILNRQPSFFVCVPVTSVARLAFVLLLQTQNSEMHLGGPMIELIETLTILHILVSHHNYNSHFKLLLPFF